MPEHVSPIHPTSTPEDRFADTLDALTLGMALRSGGDASLTTLARSIDRIGLQTDAFQDNDPVTLDRAAKRRIWADLMREHGGSTAASPVPQSPGAAGSTLAPNPWAARPDPKPKRARAATGVLRFIPAAQPTSTFLLVVAVLVLIGGTFASLAPNGGQGVIRDASATEHPAQLVYASPEASPVADACMVETPVNASTEPLPDRGYRGAYGVPELHELYVSGRWEQMVACGPFDGVTGEIPVSMMTDRRAAEDADISATAWTVTEEEAAAILSYPLEWYELEEMERLYNSALEAHPGFAGEPLALDADLGVYRQLGDGRVALHSGAWRLAKDGRIEPASYPSPGTRVTVHIFAPQDRQWLYDETLLLCIGECEGFETSGAPKPQLTIATPDAADHQWYSPLMNEDCALSAEERAATPAALPSKVTDPADYVPFTAANEADRIAAATTYLRVVSGCEAPGDATLLAEGGGAVLDGVAENGLNQSQIDTAQAITEALGYTDPIALLVANASASTITDGEGVYTLHPQHVLLPDNIVQLPDGRLGGMARIQVLPEPTGVWDWYGSVVTLFVVFDEVDESDGTWAMAESFLIFVGPGYVPEHEVDSSGLTDPAMATPIASPVASPVATPIE